MSTRKKTCVINLIGGPSVGKSVCAGLIFAELKIQRWTTEYVQEYVKHLVWGGDLETIKNQYFVSTQQYKLLKNVDGKVDFIVTDGSLIHGLYYNRMFKDNVSNVEKTDAKIREYINHFTNIFIFLEKGDFPFETEGRLHSYEESVQINKDLQKLLDDMNVPYLRVKSDKSNIPMMLHYILDQRE